MNMQDIYNESIAMINDGVRFNIDLSTKTFRLGKQIIVDHGKFDGCSGLEVTDTATALSRIEELYGRYKHSIPSERSDAKRKLQFYALPEAELEDEDMFYGIRREQAQAELELFILFSVLNGSLKWEDMEPDGANWFFWQSTNDKDLVIMKSMVATN